MSGNPTTGEPGGGPSGEAVCKMLVSPASVTVAASAQQQFAATACTTTGQTLQWAVDGTVGGNSIGGAISALGLYSAPAIDPGAAVAISIVDPSSSVTSSTAMVNVANPALTPLQGATYAETLQGWNASLLPWIEGLSGLAWDPIARTWNPVKGWTEPAEGIAPNIYYLEQALRPATRMAIAHRDIPLMEELAAFHVALLEQRTMTIANFIASAPPLPASVLFIDGPQSARTFPWYKPYNATQVQIRDCQLCNAQYLSTAARLLRVIAQLPEAARTPPLLTFVQQYSAFLVSEQLLRMLYGTTPWSDWDNPDIPQPVVSAWAFLAATGYRPPYPIKFEASMTDTELWLVASSAEVLEANREAPELNLLDSGSQSLLLQAVGNGVSLIQARCRHRVAPDGADVLSLFAGDYDDHPDYAFAGITTQEQPTVPDPAYGLGWDISHSYRFPVIFRTLYETQPATGVTFPAINDLIALGNSYVHLAYNGNRTLPAFNNFIDGSNGWFGVEQTDIPNGYPPYEYCQSQRDPDNCLTPGALQGWGELSYVNPSLAALSQTLINLAYDDSAATMAFKDQHYYYAGQHYSANSGTYPQLMVYVAAENAERLQ